jgi:hypothetical protein
LTVVVQGFDKATVVSKKFAQLLLHEHKCLGVVFILQTVFMVPEDIYVLKSAVEAVYTLAVFANVCLVVASTGTYCQGNP